MVDKEKERLKKLEEEQKKPVRTTGAKKTKIFSQPQKALLVKIGASQKKLDEARKRAVLKPKLVNNKEYVSC